MNIHDFGNLRQWATEQWGEAELGDTRRTQRAIRLGEALAANPGGSLPEQTGNWGELKAAYRLLAEADVTHARISQPHWDKTHQDVSQSESEIVLFVQDTSELDYTSQVKTRNLGHIGDTRGRGLKIHSCLAVVPTLAEVPTIVGLAAQKVWKRTEVKRGKESRTQRACRQSESDLWAETLEAIGAGPEPLAEQIWVSVGDRASDVFSYLRRAKAMHWHCLLRVCQNRVVQTPEGVQGKLLQLARSQQAMGETQVELRGRNGEPKRLVQLQVAWFELSIIAPKRGTERYEHPQSGWCIRVWEETTRSDGLEWVLFTTVPVTKHQALEQVSWYALRWLIEEYHKCLKTGCAIEQRQLTTAEGLERLLGFLSIVATRLLQLRTLARTDSTLPAETAVPPVMVTVLKAYLRLSNSSLTLHEFWIALARLGGFIGRKSDGNPGWQTLWKGWLKLHDLCWGVNFVPP